MSMVAASSFAVPHVPIGAPVGVSRPSDQGQSPSKSTSDGSDPFGPAVVVDLSPAAKEVIKRPSILGEGEDERSATIDSIVRDMQAQLTEWSKKRGKSDQEIQGSLATLEIRVRDGMSRADESKKYENQTRVNQPNLEQALLDSGGPQSLINAVRDVTSVRYDVGASGVSEASYATEENRARVRLTHGEEYLQKAIARGKVSDARARGGSSGSASALSRYGIDKPAFTVTDTGALKINSFTLQNVGGGYSLAFDAERSEFKVSRQGVDITAAIFAGKAFS